VSGFTEYTEHDGLGLAELVRSKQVAAEEVLEAAIERIEALNPALNAVVTRVYDEARAAPPGSNPQMPFAGVPFLLKDLGGAQAGVPMSAGSRFFAHAATPVDAETVVRYKRAGLRILGRTNTPEFGLNASTEPVLFGPCRNPWDTTRSSGGSSGGAAAAVAARMVPLAHASDGGGSIRIPASCCGLFGMKTTRARLSFAPYVGEALAGCAVEHVVSRSVRDSAAALDATAGPAIGDPYFPPPPERPWLDEVGTAPAPLRIALATETFAGEPVHADCVAAAQAAARLCEELGHHVERAAPQYDVSGLDETYNLLFAISAAANLRLRARSLGLTPEPGSFERVTWGMVEQADQVSAADYVQMLNRLHAISRRIQAFFVDYDMLLTPTLAEPPVKLGVLNMMSEDLTAYTERLWRYTPFTYPFNVTGQPAMSVPLAWNDDGLPIGVHFVGRFGDEATLFRLAGQLEEARPWAERRPPDPA
jgi:amidase